MPKVLVYITTHMPDGHVNHFRNCWPRAMQRSRLLNSSDVAVFWTQMKKHNSTQLNERMKILHETFQDQNLKIYNFTNDGYHEGAMAALSEASRHHYFDGYDWVIRLNPDVIIRDDSWMIDTMINDIDAKLLYVDCRKETKDGKKNLAIHTDFFVLKVRDLPGNIFANLEIALGAEGSFTKKMESIISNKQHRHVPGARPEVDGFCRADYLPGSPVVHTHEFKLKNGHCPAFDGIDANDSFDSKDEDWDFDD